VLLEGTQGFGLSLHHGYFPFATSRDTTVGVLCSEAGLAPTLVRQVVMVVRTYPIRVAGNSGPLPDEVDWDTVTRESRAPRPIVERTTVYGEHPARRAIRHGHREAACMVNRPTQIAVTFAAYIDWRISAVASLAELTPSARRFIDAIEESCEVPVTLIGTGPRTSDIIDLRGDKL
jgi:adenylosuccinate synthase